jgi:carbon-monoxide dehydrogenase large subunit
MTIGGPGRQIGRPMTRVEDARLLVGKARYVDDIAPPGLLHAAFLRSPVAHGLVRRLDAAEARAAPGVRAVLTWADIRPYMQSDRIPLAVEAGAIRFHVDPPCLVQEEACYVGEPVAMVVAESRATAEDAARRIELEMEPLPAVIDPVAGLEPGAARARLDTPDNLVARTAIRYGDIDEAFKRAALVVGDTFHLHKGGPHFIETRGLIARWDADEERLEVWSNTQMPHRAKAVLVSAMGLGEHQVKVSNPDVGGGFGPKALFHPEELAIPIATRILGAPVKWIEDRAENFVACAGERNQVWEMEMAVDAEGRMLALRGRLSHDHGAATPYGIALPYNAASNVVGPYVLPVFHIDIRLCLTNMVPATSTRGAGRPQGMMVMERLLDAVAGKLGLGRDEVRRRNLIPAERMPFATPVVMRDGSAMTYDSGDYPESQRRVLEAAGWSDFPQRKEQARREGRLIGIGLSNYVEGTGRGPFESATIRVGPSGRIEVATGATAQGQGVRTVMTQLVADVLDVDPALVHVVAGDTTHTPMGLGAFASRQTVTAGNAIHQAAREVAEKAKAVVSHMLEVSPGDLEISGGMVQVKGVPGKGKSLAEISRAISGVPGFALPGNTSPGLAASCDFQVNALTFCNGSHVCEVEVDPETGRVSLTRYVVVHDCGRMINPMMVEGQVEGAVVHGIAMTLYEWMRFTDEGQPLSLNYGEYLLPTADGIPRIEIHHMESPTPLNPLGVKGAGESGTIGAPAAIVSAIEDALAPLPVRITDLPVTPERLRAAIARARRK